MPAVLVEIPLKPTRSTNSTLVIRKNTAMRLQMAHVAFLAFALV